MWQILGPKNHVVYILVNQIHLRGSVLHLMSECKKIVIFIEIPIIKNLKSLLQHPMSFLACLLVTCKL
jgi:hypothetical protein